MTSDKRPAKLALEDGTVFTGTSFGAAGEVDGEVCFNTSMTGYQAVSYTHLTLPTILRV